jgi:phage gp46-like protein
MTNATKVSRVDDAHGELENDLGEILGVTDNQEITNPILGTAPGGGKSVQGDGSIRGTPILKMSSPTGDPASAIGFQFADGTKTKKLAFTNSGLAIWEWDGTSWTQVANIENPGSGAGTFLSLSDVDDSDYSGKAGYLVKVNAGADGLELVAPAAGSGITRFVDASDTPAPYNGTPFNPADAGKLVYVVDSSTLGLTAPPTGIGDPFVMWIYASAASNWGRNSWIDAYNWAFVSVPGGDGGFLTDTASLLTNDGLAANKFIELATTGVYRMDVWYTTTTTNKTGTRSWRLVENTATIAGLAEDGADQHANFWFNSGTTAGGVAGLQFLGSRQFLVTSAGKVKVQVKQTANQTLAGVVFYANITRIK